MKRFALLGMLLIPGPLLAQQQQPSPEMSACQGEILELTGGKFQLRTQVAALQARVVELQKQIDDAKPKEAPKP